MQKSNKSLYFREQHDNEGRNMKKGNIVHNLPKLNVVRRINFDGEDEDASVTKNTIKTKSPKRESERIRFFQNLKQEINNAKNKTLKENNTCCTTRSSAKKRSEEIKKIHLSDFSATKNNPKGGSKDVIKCQSALKCSTINIDRKKDLVNVESNNETNIKPILEQSQTLQLVNFDEHKTPDKLVAYTENVEFNTQIQRSITRSMSKNLSKMSNTQNSHTLEKKVLEQPITTRLDETATVSNTDHESLKLGSAILQKNTSKKPQDATPNEWVQKNILEKLLDATLSKTDEEQGSIKQKDLEQFINPEKVTDDFHENLNLETDVLHNMTAIGAQHAITKNESPDVKLIKSENDAKPIFAQNEDVSVNLTVLPFNIDMQEELDNDPILRDQEFTNYIHRKIQSMDIGSEDHTLKKMSCEQYDSYHSSASGSFEQSHAQVVEAVIHTHNSKETFEIPNIQKLPQPLSEASTPNTLPKTNDIYTQLTEPTTSSLLLTDNIPEQKVTMLRHSSLLDYLGILKINEDTTPCTLSKEATSMQDISVTIDNMNPVVKTMKKRDYFNKEYRAEYTLPYEKQITIVNTKTINPGTTKIIGKSKQQQKVLDSLKEVNLNDTINIKKRKITKRKLTADLDSDNTQVIEDFNNSYTENFENLGPKHSKRARFETRSNNEKIKHVKMEKTKTNKNARIVKLSKVDVQIKPKSILTRKRKREIAEEDKLTEPKEKTLKIVIAPLEMDSNELHFIEQDTSENNQDKHLDAIEILEDFNDYDIKEDKPINTATGKHVLRKRDNKKSYIDFLSDNEDFEWSSSSWEGSFESDTDKEVPRKKAKKQKSVPDAMENSISNTILDLRMKKKRKNKRVENQTSKQKGEEYVTRKGKHVPGKYMKDNPCTPDNCNNGCYEISIEKRQNLFRHYWSLSATRKRDWLITNSTKMAVKRKRTHGLSRRTGTFQYFINEGEGRRRVCLQFVINTLDIRQKFIHNTLCNHVFGSSKDDSRGKRAPGNKTSEEVIAAAKQYLGNLPVLPSHYCRKNSTKLYLPESFRNLSNLYKIYKEAQSLEAIPTVNESLFRKIYKDFNYGFHVPRKDKCIQCLKYENDKSPDMEQIQQHHLKDKEDTYNRFKIHQNIHQRDKSILCVSFDLQKVLNTPFSRSILLFYYRKLSVFNLTFYECGTKEGHCYTWSEVEGKRGANEICSILKLYIQKIDNRGFVKHLLLYSDCCPGQNRNKIVVSCVQKCLESCNNLDTIQLNYLLPGHTYMPVDSMHSVIEKSVKNTTIWTPSQWAVVFSLARKNPKPYEVNVMTHKDFMDWESLVPKNHKKILTGKISKIRTITFKKSSPGTLYIKYSMDPKTKTESINMPINVKQAEPKRAYKSKLPITKKKQEDFDKMCSLNIIPETYHNDYLNLHYSNTVEDVLQDTDIEDVNDDQ